MKLSIVFKELRKLKEKKRIRNFSISMTGLEEMFVKMAQEPEHVSNMETLLEVV